MRRSKLEVYEDILKALVNEPLALDRVALETNVHLKRLIERLDFLLENKLVDERQVGGNVSYAITERGIVVLRTLNFQKYLEKVSSNIKVIDEALEILRRLEKHKLERDRKSNGTS